MTTSTLAQDLSAHAPTLNARAVARMYEDPFWEERFGERGRKFSQEDGLYHFTYLGQALTAGAATSLVAYAAWLRSVLVPRGMCTQHLVEHFAVMRDVLGDAGLCGAETAQRFLDEAALALSYRDASAGELARVESSWVKALSESAAAASAAKRELTHDWTRQARYLVSYCADALAFTVSEPLAGYVHWARGSFSRRQLAAGFEAMLQALSRCIAAAPTPLRRPLESVLGAIP